MDKKTAQNLIEDTFNDSFSEERFTIFAKNLLNDIEPKSNFYTGNLIWDDYKEHINTYKRIGKYIDPEGEALDVLIIEVKSITKLERARTVLRNFVIKHLSKFEKDYALVAFYSKEDDGNDWRFSFIKLEYKSELDEEKGKVKTKKEFTPAKRYSFLVGKYEKAHTAKNQLLPLLQNIANNPTIEELEAAFSIEKVTDEFFNQYKDLFVKLYEHFDNDSHVKAAIDKAQIDTTRFTKKLLGQIVFLYFLQKKGWLGVPKNERWGTGKKRFVQELNEQAQAEGVNFFKDKLQYLFYEALAKERDNVNSYYERFKCRIPFLNGGLFEADYDWRNANITIPETLFRNKEKNKSGDEGTGVLDVFDRYNFTIKEDEPLDKEVAVDPEMLGKVFENMLDITERKSKGAFYTPREIVHYMCQESLIHYLDNALNSSKSSPPLKEEYPKGEVVDKSINNLPYLKTFRKNLRNNLTPAEAALWKMLQGKQLEGRKFRRQHSVANYILDFYCPAENLAIELDGQGHFEATQAEYDYERDLFLNHCGIKVLRFENKWVWDNPEGLLGEVKNNFGWSEKQPPRPTDTPPLEGGEKGVVKKDIETYIREGHFALENDERVAAKGETKTYKYQLPESIRQNADLIDQKLSDIRICDPAIGSGAFPVGLLHELVNAMLVLKPHFSDDYLGKKLKDFSIPFKESYSESRYIYRLKRHIIQESIYGVDIDASAIDIARLRLWLSLVVDEDDLDPIETLPNLDYKIVCGNSLIGMPETAMRNLQVEKELEDLKEKFYDITDETKKKALRQEINSKIRELLDSAEQFAGYKIDFDFKLFFSEVWREKGGFDVVIGNPPYVKARDNNNKLERKLIERRFKTCYKMWDIFIPFIEHGIELSNKKHGVCIMIIPDTIGVADYTTKLVEFIESSYFLDSIVFFPNQYVFDTASVRSKIVSIDKVRNNRKTKRIEFKSGQFIPIKPSVGFEKYLFETSSLKFNMSNTVNLGDICYVSYGLRLNSDKNDPDKFTKKDLISEKKTSLNPKKYTEGKYLEKYKISKIFYVEWDTERSPKRLVRPTFPELYEPEKLLMARQKKAVAFSKDGIICDNTIILAVLHKDLKKVSNRSVEKYYKNVSIERSNGIKNSSNYNLKYLLAILNSSYISYFLKYYTKGKIDVYPDDWKQIPISPATYEIQLIFVVFVDYLLELRNGTDTESILIDYFTHALDSLVFELYFPEEIKLAGKEILKHLGELIPITDEMSEEEKLAIIQSEFERLYDPNHPVRFAIETLDSVEEVRIIKEALK